MTVELGINAPDFALEANNGETVRLSDYKGKECGSILLSKGHDTWMHDRGM